jgi:transcriptional regulator with XRE-family HTH domain
MELRYLANRLEERRKRLGLSCAIVAHRAGLGLRTVQRALSGDAITAEFSTLNAIAQAMGASVRLKLEGEDVERLKEQQARRKARQLVALTQGTSALEAQAVSKSDLARMTKQTARKLLTGSTRKLWAD